MTNVNTQYWKRVIAYFDRVEKGEERPDFSELLSRAKRIAIRGQALNDRVAELEAEVARLHGAWEYLKYDINRRIDTAQENEDDRVEAFEDVLYEMRSVEKLCEEARKHDGTQVTSG